MRNTVDGILFLIWNSFTFLLGTHVVEALWHDNVILALVGLVFFPGGVCRGFNLWVGWLSAMF
ncbi:hypothetical protein [uncultured Bartonella sp.]|uniref:hypothetical protein n=1 Tax=uncultured Bartonella sp. TaxID=104108 RepID=UPI0025E3A7E5|nr:hypothetical protein [uncultured Bartonella sp.]